MKFHPAMKAGSVTDVKKLEPGTLLERTDILDLCLTWLKRNCNAEIINKGVSDGRKVEYYIEGEDIPKGNEPFALQCEVIADGALLIQIETFNYH